MLKKKQKTKRSEFLGVVSRGIVSHTTHFTLRTLISNRQNKKDSAFSFVVSRKISNSATKRNLLKRRGYAVVKKHLKNIKGGYINVFFFKKNSPNISFQELEQEIVFLIKKNRLLYV